VTTGYPTRKVGTERLSIMFLATADCIVVKATLLEPGITGAAEETAAGFDETDAAGAEVAVTGATLLFGVIPAAASTSAGVILPKGPVPLMELISTLCCFASFFA
jgi:hypothetical protein